MMFGGKEVRKTIGSGFNMYVKVTNKVFSSGREKKKCCKICGTSCSKSSERRREGGVVLHRAKIVIE